ncbi:MAG: DUF4386 domain-containing protein [Desulfobacterales bacterium]|nr:DUF4386 domain-containing protein [Desulfobacterales bacterium]
MTKNRKTAIFVGMLFLTAMVASLLGGGLIDSIISAPDYLKNVSENEIQMKIGVFLELINAIAVVGIAVLLFPILKQYNEKIALGYFGFRIIEAVFCSVIVISPLSLITLGQEYLKTGAADASSFQTSGILSMAGRASVAGLLIPVFFSLGALLLYSFLYRSTLLPRFISVWGLIGVVLILSLSLISTLNVLEVGLSTGLIFALPIITNEIFLGIWLIVKGFNATASVSEPA